MNDINLYSNTKSKIDYIKNKFKIYLSDMADTLTGRLYAQNGFSYMQ